MVDMMRRRILTRVAAIQRLDLEGRLLSAAAKAAHNGSSRVSSRSLPDLQSSACS